MNTKLIAIALIMWAMMGYVLGLVVGYNVAQRRFENVIDRLENQFQMSIER